MFTRKNVELYMYYMLRWHTPEAEWLEGTFQTFLTALAMGKEGRGNTFYQC